MMFISLSSLSMNSLNLIDKVISLNNGTPWQTLSNKDSEPFIQSHSFTGFSLQCKRYASVCDFPDGRTTKAEVQKQRPRTPTS